jgi:hypothetical protein
MPGFSFPTVGPLCIGSPPTRYGLPASRTIGTMIRYDCQQPISGSLLSLVSRYLVLLFLLCPVSLGLLFGLEFSSQYLGSCLSSVPLLLTYHKETVGSPKFPRCPHEHLPRSQTPVVSYTLALSYLGLLPSVACRTSAFSLLVERLSSTKLSFVDHDYTYFGAQSRGLRPCSSQLQTPVTGLTCGVHY